MFNVSHSKQAIVAHACHGHMHRDRNKYRGGGLSKGGGWSKGVRLNWRVQESTRAE